MDSNVSKTTFFYKFIKLQFSPRNCALEDLLKQDLLRTIDLYSQRQNIDIDLQVIAQELDRKILLLQSSSLASFLDNCEGKADSKLQFTNLVYRCAIAFPLTSYCQLSPQHIARELAQNMGSLAYSNFEETGRQGNSAISPSSLTKDSFLEFAVMVYTSGYIDFYLKETCLAIWLKRLLDFLVAKSIPPSIYAPISIKQPKNSPNLVPLQYVHTRCCSLLHLGERE